MLAELEKAIMADNQAEIERLCNEIETGTGDKTILDAVQFVKHLRKRQ